MKKVAHPKTIELRIFYPFKYNRVETLVKEMDCEEPLDFQSLDDESMARVEMALVQSFVAVQKCRINNSKQK